MDENLETLTLEERQADSPEQESRMRANLDRFFDGENVSMMGGWT